MLTKLLLVTSSILVTFIVSGRYYKVNAQEIYSSLTFVKKADRNYLSSLQEAKGIKKAIIYGYIAAEHRERGDFPEAITYWDKAIKIYELENNQELLAQALVDQAQAYLSQGNYRKATKLLVQAIETAQFVKAPETEVVAWGALGNARNYQGNYDEALVAYQKSLKLAEEVGNHKYSTIALNNLFSLFYNRSSQYFIKAEEQQAQGDAKSAAQLLQLGNQDLNDAAIVAKRAIVKAPGGMSEAKALINLISLSPRNEYKTRIQNILKSLPNNREKAYTIINFAERLDLESKINLLEWANSIAQNIGDGRAQSFALGAIGRTYEQTGQFDKALNLTIAAQESAQRDKDSLYRWQWQAGRIYVATGDINQAIASYKNAISTLQNIRSDIIGASSDLQFDVRDEVEPVYRELITLLLDKGQVEEVLPILDLLKLTELQDFFGDECLEIARTVSTLQNAASERDDVLIYSIILQKKTYIILRLPNGKLKSYPVELTAKELQNEIKHFRFTLEDNGNVTYFKLSQKLYNILIRPLEADLATVKSNHLVFINDGILRNIPMAALHDGKQFLVQKYVISMSLGLNLENLVLRGQQRALVFGLTVAVPPFGSLPNVNNETEQVSNILRGTRFLNEKFTSEMLEKQLQSRNYSVIHIATHSRFSGTAQGTFLQVFNKQIFLKEFEKIMRKNKNSIELLTLSACQTAVGDNRSLLGLAGIAVRNNVKNVLASLWFINDARTVKLMNEFYNQLNQPDMTKAEALRNAQIKLIPNFHPAVWSPFVMISN